VFFSFIFESDPPRFSELIRALHTARRHTGRRDGWKQACGDTPFIAMTSSNSMRGKPVATIVGSQSEKPS
jgi:hypothetical protein